jgi:periplasmic divalent cation tolerance protein
MTNFIVVLATAGSEKEAETIADKLIQERKAACVNIIPSLKSVYWWKGKKESSKQFLMIIKSRREILDEVVESVKSIHSDKIPEIIALPIKGGNSDYLKWIASEIR